MSGSSVLFPLDGNEPCFPAKAFTKVDTKDHVTIYLTVTMPHGTPLSVMFLKESNTNICHLLAARYCTTIGSCHFSQQLSWLLHYAVLFGISMPYLWVLYQCFVITVPLEILLCCPFSEWHEVPNTQKLAFCYLVVLFCTAYSATGQGMIPSSFSVYTVTVSPYFWSQGKANSILRELWSTSDRVCGLTLTWPSSG